MTFDNSFKDAVALKSSADKLLTIDLLPETVIFKYCSDLTLYTISLLVIALSFVTDIGIFDTVMVFSGSLTLTIASHKTNAINTARNFKPILFVRDIFSFVNIFFIASPSFQKSSWFNFLFILSLYKLIFQN